MKISKKVKAGMAARIKAWNELPGGGGSSMRTKMVRMSETHAAYHCPGSQNRKKSGTGHRSTKH